VFVVLFVVFVDVGVDLLWGIGGMFEGVILVAVIKCIGG